MLLRSVGKRVEGRRGRRQQTVRARAPMWTSVWWQSRHQEWQARRVFSDGAPPFNSVLEPGPRRGLRGALRLLPVGALLADSLPSQGLVGGCRPREHFTRWGTRGPGPEGSLSRSPALPSLPTPPTEPAFPDFRPASPLSLPHKAPPPFRRAASGGEAAPELTGARLWCPGPCEVPVLRLI